MLALVTGPTGFLGSHLVERLLAAGHRVRALVYEPDKTGCLCPKRVEIVAGDITRSASLAPALRGVDVVFHTAALVTNWAPWSRFLQVTVQGTENLLAESLRAGVGRFVHISTIRVYDDRFCRRQGAVHEEAPHGSSGFRHFGRYARSKVMAEAAVWRAATELPVSVLRPAWIYGPRDETIIPPLLRFLKKPGARWPGRVDPCADPVYVTDVADCAMAAALSPAAVGQAYNVSPPRRITVQEFLGALCGSLNYSVPTKRVPYVLARLAAVASEWWAWLRRRTAAPLYTRAGLAILTEDVRHEPAKAAAQLGWQAKVDMTDGVCRTAAWLKERHPDLAA